MKLLSSVLVMVLMSAGPIVSAEVVLHDAWTRATPPGATTSAVYGVLENDDAVTRTLLDVSSSQASMTMIHDTQVTADGVMRMRHLHALPVAAGEQVRLQPGGTHIMLSGLKSPLTEGSTLDVTLKFESGLEISVQAKVGAVSQTAYPD